MAKLLGSENQNYKHRQQYRNTCRYRERAVQSNHSRSKFRIFIMVVMDAPLSSIGNQNSPCEQTARRVPIGFAIFGPTYAYQHKADNNQKH